MKTVNLIFGACLAILTSQVFAQSALNDANRKAMSVVIEEGKRCVEGLQPQNIAAFVNPSPETKSLLLTPPTNLTSAAGMRNLNEQQRKVIIEMSKTAISCQAHQENLEVLFRDLATKEAAIKNDSAAKDMLAKVGEASARVGNSMEAIAKNSPDLSHFLHAHGQGK